ncbi:MULTISPECIES: MBL fold metallo-hydrolase [unclassified Paenibacillus]|uniref:MBL fold metallo-hydrolase n=1 Tax=unclassified Paenibacillus TaxID=185978 RepID=UPI001AE5DC0F|nr:MULTISPECIES: MBL fold metallo-hydrolase [unclassified Paenibacillus]MBP1156996.1 glyoxylase-like metal-dependent hydrolase (beta-lactamase superfamily II) [Paenibacillus sp. PvP091]MBP1172265.1 glyoxylase-like metal-dependent hydrolase (beta-lactamase superfamily II) [Paenibacillus sp. PvR098]MBP2438646.1 glyoxylase-like metal-dependent hydrolase (beta-lactamase superfamily II) [Paenibacillus sp. PvP052]
MEQIRNNLFRIPIPVPFPMKYIYCYLAVDKQGVVMIDVGFNDQAAQEAWKQAFTELKLQPRDIKVIYLTHFHPDHFGLAGWMQELTGAPVYISEPDMAMVDRAWRNDDVQAQLVGRMAKDNGVPDLLAEQIVEHMLKLHNHVLPLPELRPLTMTEVRLGDELWQVIPTPGHSDGHRCLYQPESRLLLAGDHILDKITPNISLWPGGRPNPLQDYVQSLQQTAALDISLALPAHGKLIDNVPQRVTELLEHHEQRLEQMRVLAKQGRTAYEVASDVFRHKELSPHQWRFAMAETLAHLECLTFQGKLNKSQDGQIWIYTQSNQN